MEFEHFPLVSMHHQHLLAFLLTETILLQVRASQSLRVVCLFPQRIARRLVRSRD